MLNYKKKFNYFLVPIGLSLIVILISLLPLPKLPELKFVASDKLGHLLAFLFLIICYLWAFSKERPLFKFSKSAIISFIICTILGGGIELLQHYLPINRYGDWNDFYFDITGIIIGLILFRMAFKRKLIVVLVVLLLPQWIYSQNIQVSKEFQEELNREFMDVNESPLDSVDLIGFKGLEFFPISEKYIVRAKLVKDVSPYFFEFETSTARRPEYRVWAIAHFTLDDVECTLTIYQSKKLMNTLEYGDYLFLPFSDLTNGKSTYYGGRYVDLRITDGDEITIDFNKSYNPYCAYSDRFSCPIVPDNNSLELKIEAGVKKFH